MKHLKEIEMTYLGHLKLAIINSFKLLFSSVILLIHGLIPSLFVKTTSAIIENVKRSFPQKKDRILVRFNTKWRDDWQNRQWRILVNGVETLAHKVVINTQMETIEEEVSGEQKFHFLCSGKVIWDKTNAEIK